MTISFISVVSLISIGMLIWSCIEVGSNDAANLVNAVFGSRILERHKAVILAGIFVILGTMYASPVVDTVRSGIFNIQHLTAQKAVSIFLASYIVNTVILYTYSGYGLPISTTATLIFSLAGGALGVSGDFSIIYWSTLAKVILAIFLSIFLSAIVAFLVQRIFRGAIRKNCQNHETVMLHGPWITSLIILGLTWFMLVKGMHLVQAETLLQWSQNKIGGSLTLFFSLWAALAMFIWGILFVFGKKITPYLFHVTAVLGMICMSFAFGQNDLANCASPGLANLLIWQNGITGAADIQIPSWGLFACGFLIFLGMRTTRAQRVTRAEVNTASQQNTVKIYAPEWCCAVARFILKNTEAFQTSDKTKDIAPSSKKDPKGKKKHYDPLRASVILSVSASVIAAASGLGIPISTTYVSFAAVIATGWADCIFTRGASELKVGRTIWVITLWFVGGLIAVTCTGLVAFTLYRLEYLGIILVFLLNISIRLFFKNRANQHETMYHTKTKKIGI